ncbi:hypothetical protein ASC75_19350 [Aminobacter sp. DSM 101952]|nr:hypothetical protein ASC75_19350 [Aminobacter sp. DSM 101952]
MRLLPFHLRDLNVHRKQDRQMLQPSAIRSAVSIDRQLLAAFSRLLGEFLTPRPIIAASDWLILPCSSQIFRLNELRRRRSFSIKWIGLVPLPKALDQRTPAPVVIRNREARS